MSEKEWAGGSRAAMVAVGERGIQIQNVQDALSFAKMFVDSGLAPDGDTANKVVMKLQAGLELGLQPMQALQLLIVTDKGRLSMMSVGMLALIRRSPLCEYADVSIEGEGDKRKAVFISKRVGRSERKVEYSVNDAMTARLWNKKIKTRTGGEFETPWVTSPEDMLVARVISRGAKRYWSDVIYGLEVAEVARDIDAGPQPQPGPTDPPSADPAPGGGPLEDPPPDPLIEQLVEGAAPNKTVVIGGIAVDREELEREAAEYLAAEQRDRD